MEPIVPKAVAFTLLIAATCGVAGRPSCPDKVCRSLAHKASTTRFVPEHTAGTVTASITAPVVYTFRY
jgi:hypothetical protein